jgi:hypothetical protein
MSKNVVEPERPRMTIWRRVACWISKATRAQAHDRAPPTHTRMYPPSPPRGRRPPPPPPPTHTQKYFFPTATTVSWTRLNVTLYVHCLSCLYYVHQQTCFSLGSYLFRCSFHSTQYTVHYPIQTLQPLIDAGNNATTQWNSNASVLHGFLDFSVLSKYMAFVLSKISNEERGSK